MRNLHWPTKKLGEVCEVVSGFAFPKHLQGKRDLRYPFFKVGDMNNDDDVMMRAENTVDDNLLEVLGARIYPKGTVVFPKVGGAVLTNKKRILGVDASFDNNVMGLVAMHGVVLDRWLLHWMLGLDLRSLANTQALPSIRKSVVSELGIPLPPLDEQRRIVEKLDAQMKEVEKVRAAVDAKFEAARALPSSFLRTVFNSPESQTWPVKKLGEVCDLYQPKTITAKEILADGPYKVFGANGIIGYYDRYNHENEEVVVTCRGATCGTINVTEPRSWITGNAMVVHPKSPETSKAFLQYVLRAADFSIAISGAAQPQITRSSLAPLPIVLPISDDQRRIVARLDEQMAHANALIRALESEREAITALPTALLREVFG